VYVYVLAGILLFLIFPDSRKGPQLAPTIRADRSRNQAGTWSNSHPKTGLFSGHQNRMSYFAFVQSEESQRLTKQAGIHKKGPNLAMEDACLDQDNHLYFHCQGQGLVLYGFCINVLILYES
jgi:hypothetical protein